LSKSVTVINSLFFLSNSSFSTIMIYLIFSFSRIICSFSWLISVISVFNWLISCSFSFLIRCYFSNSIFLLFNWSIPSLIVSIYLFKYLRVDDDSIYLLSILAILSSYLLSDFYHWIFISLLFLAYRRSFSRSLLNWSSNREWLFRSNY
jgi:hypothetical protein